jgi:hypothetical protein
MACAQQSKKTNPSPNLLSLDTMTTEYLLDTLEASINLSKDGISKLEADYQEPTNLTKKKPVKPLIVPSEEDNLPISTTSMSTKDQNASNLQQKKTRTQQTSPSFYDKEGRRRNPKHRNDRFIACYV